MQKHTIKNAFKALGMWPIAYKTVVKKIRVYRKKKRSINEMAAKGKDELDLPPLLPIRSGEIWTLTTTLRELNDRDPTKFLDNSIIRWHTTVSKVDVAL